MEADWSVALGNSDPVITIPWAASGAGARGRRFVDLRLRTHLIEEIEEAQTRPAMAFALRLLNSDRSALWTAKCDAWNRSAAEDMELIDPYEMDAGPEETAFSAGSYIDLLAHDSAFLSSFDRQEQWMRAVTTVLRTIRAQSTRVELIMRRANINGMPGFGVTWFAEGCGAAESNASASWARALELALPVLMDPRLM